MNGFTENRASDSLERSGLTLRILTWQASSAMLPLAGRIAHDIVTRHEQLAQIRTELHRLERARHTLAWPERHRRYSLEDEIVTQEGELRTLEAELDSLGVVLLDSETGTIGFPTRVNERLAFFSWMPGEAGLDYWNYADDARRRSVPHDWRDAPLTRRRRKSKK